jgi:hypothetical protein
MAYNATTNSLATRSAQSVGTALLNAPATAITATIAAVEATTSYIAGVVVQSAQGIATASVSASALAGIQMTQISGPVPVYTVTTVIYPVQSWGS